MRLALLLLFAALGASCRRGEAPPAPPPASARPAAPAQLGPILEAETRLMSCFEARVSRIAPFIDAGRPMPAPEASETQCVDAGVRDVLALPAPPGTALDEWWVLLETLRSCRGEIAFASVTEADLRTLSGADSGPAQAAWLRDHVASCRGTLASLRALAAPEAPPRD